MTVVGRLKWCRSTPNLRSAENMPDANIAPPTPTGTVLGDEILTDLIDQSMYAHGLWMVSPGNGDGLWGYREAAIAAIHAHVSAELPKEKNT